MPCLDTNVVYYAYVPDADGREPMGTGGKRGTRRDLTTDAGAIRWARKTMGADVRVFRVVGNFYDDAAHTRIA